MDTLTHALSGALLARVTAPATPKPGQLTLRGRIAIGFLAAAFPDSDFVVRWIDTLTYLNIHRGITHSVIMLPLWAAGLALLFTLFARGKRSWRAFFGVTVLGIGIHILGDVITPYGTMIFSPLSDLRVSFPATFIIDPYFSAIIILGLVASAVWRESRRPAVAALVVLVTYVGFQGILHQRAIGLGETYAKANGLIGAQSHALPQPLSPFNWQIIVRHDDSYYRARVNLLRKQVPPQPHTDSGLLARIDASYRPANALLWQRLERYGATPQQAILAREVWEQVGFRGFRKFALFPVLDHIDRESDRACVWFTDLRFALAGRTPPFRYGMCRDSNKDSWRLDRKDW